MSLRKLAPPVAAALLVLIVGTIIHGALTERFGASRSAELDAFAARLQNVPNEIGDWEGRDAEVEREQIARSNVAGHLSRTFRHRKSGAVVNMFLVCGTSRHITLHTPDLCYPAAGFEMDGEPASRSVEAGLPEPVEFASSHFYKEDEEGLHRLHVMWSFSSDGAWEGPRWARTALAGHSAIYKLYVIGPLAYPQQDGDRSAVEAFAVQAMPVLQKALFPHRSEQESR